MLLGKVAGDKAIKAKTWPADATRLGGKLRQASPFLRKVAVATASSSAPRMRGRTTSNAAHISASSFDLALGRKRILARHTCPTLPHTCPMRRCERSIRCG